MQKKWCNAGPDVNLIKKEKKGRNAALLTSLTIFCRFSQEEVDNLGKALLFGSPDDVCENMNK